MHLSLVLDTPSEPEPDPPPVLHGPPTPSHLIKDGHPTSLYVHTYRPKLIDMRLRFRDEQLHAVGLLGAAKEWSMLHTSHRLALLLLAGIDGELDDLMHKAWREIPHAERIAIASAARTLKRTFAPIRCLTA
ncbi:hypothetical protein WAE61_03385 [Comamonadaceae bacterium PP-2]